MCAYTVLVCDGTRRYSVPSPFPAEDIFFIFRLDALASSVIATATWLAGWLTGWLSHSGIVSENFFDRLKAPSH